MSVRPSEGPRSWSRSLASRREPSSNQTRPTPFLNWKGGPAGLFRALIFVLIGWVGSGADAEEPWIWQLPVGFPPPRVPADNPMSKAKVELGRDLFYDVRLSGDLSMSCGHCHRQELAFTDGLDRPTGITGQKHPRSTMSLANVGYSVSLTWDDPNLSALEEQLTTPIFGHDPVEMGIERSEILLQRLRSDSSMTPRFRAAFRADHEPPSDGESAPEITMDRVAKALAAFQRTLISGDSPFDRFMYLDQEDAMDASAQRGMALFFSRRLGCSDCHRGLSFSGPIQFRGSRNHSPSFHNTGLYNLPGPQGPGDYPSANPGLRRHTGKRQDSGKFRAPTLRNIAVTAPYMHDGSVPTLDAVIDHYAAGGRTLAEGPLAGVGADNPWKSPRLTGFTLSAQERQDLKAFLHALTDESFLSQADFAPPAPALAQPLF